jgi:hypothetical protein
VIVWVPPKKKLLYASRISRSGWMKAASLPRIGRRSGRLICAPILKKVLSVRIPHPALFLSCAADQSGAAGGAAEDRPLCMSCAFRQAISSFQLNFFDMTLKLCGFEPLIPFNRQFFTRLGCCKGHRFRTPGFLGDISEYLLYNCCLRPASVEAGGVEPPCSADQTDVPAVRSALRCKWAAGD